MIFKRTINFIHKFKIYLLELLYILFYIFSIIVFRDARLLSLIAIIIVIMEDYLTGLERKKKFYRYLLSEIITYGNIYYACIIDFNNLFNISLYSFTSIILLILNYLMFLVFFNSDNPNLNIEEGDEDEEDN